MPLIWAAPPGNYLDAGEGSVLALVRQAPSGAMLAVTNLAPNPARSPSALLPFNDVDAVDVFADHDYPPIASSPCHHGSSCVVLSALVADQR